MEVEDQSMKEKCENLMNVVVETRKRFGKMCVDYYQKTSFMEKKLLNLQLETISNYKFKAKDSVPSINVEDMSKDIDGFAAQILERKTRINNLREKVKDTQSVVLQLQKDNIAEKMHQPLNKETMLARAKENRTVDLTKTINK